MTRSSLSGKRRARIEEPHPCVFRAARKKAAAAAGMRSMKLSTDSLESEVGNAFPTPSYLP